MNRIKEIFLNNLTNLRMKNHLLRIPSAAAMTFLPVIFHSIRSFFFSFKEHPVRQRFIVSILSICLIVTSLPLQLSAQELTEEENNAATHELVSFSELPDEIKEQTVAKGTPVEELGLPSSLNAAESYYIRQPKAKKDSKELSGIESSEETPNPDSADPVITLPEGETDISLTPLNGEESTEETTNPAPSAEQPEETEEETDAGEETEEILTVDEITVDGVTWVSTPEYDSETEGAYTFSPVLPQGYSLKEGARQPEIMVTVGEPEDTTGADEGDIVIDNDTAWTDDRTLENQNLIINSGKTLTINGVITTKGKVTINGEGKIVRGSDNACINAAPAASLTIEKVTIDGQSLNASRAMITLTGASLTMGGGCRIQNCKTGNDPQLGTDGNGDKKGGAIRTSGNNNVIILNDMTIAGCSAEHQGGAIELAGLHDDVTLNNPIITDCSAAKGGAICAEYIFNTEGKSAITLNNPTIENCKASFYGGAICLERNRSAVTINGGTYRNNATLSGEPRDWGGGAVYNSKSLLYINGGNFIGNSTKGKGGAIHHCGQAGTETYINGGSFEGNSCSNGQYTGSGAIYHSVLESGINDLCLSGNAKFSGGGANGTDGIYLDKKDGINNGKPKEILISNTLNYPITLYAEAVENDYIAEGKNYSLLSKDMKQINYVHATDTGLKLYADLKNEVNKAVLTSSEPEHKYYIHYIIPNEATGTIESDDTGYKNGDTFTVKSGEKLMKNGYPFIGWNAKEDGTGEFYDINKNYTMPDHDLYLYAVFQSHTTEYRIKFDLNGTAGDCPQTQIVPYGGYVQTVAEPVRRGYSFKGWYKDTEGTERNRWNFEKTVENNTKETSVTLYAKWVDDIAPVLGATSFNTGYKDLKGWIIRKKNLIITVPITEEGSGVKRADYVLRPEKGSAFSGEAQIENNEILVTGKNDQSSESVKTTAGTQQPAAIITVDQDFKGTVSLSCVDNADNVSASRTLTAADGGVIVEDHAPEIRFSAGKNDNGSVSVMVSVKDDIDSSGGNYITGGIAEIRYQIDEKAENTETEKNFSESIVPFYDFTVDISKKGSHTLTVTAIDHAGNQNQQNLKVNIAGKRTSQENADTSGSSPQAGNTYTAFSDFAAPVNLQIPQDREPDTRDTSTRIEVYATIAMIAGLSYLLLYFTTGKNGLLEEEKNALVAKWIRWARQGKKYRKLIALTAIFCLLFYYHSIGKRVTVKWKEVYGK